MGIFNNIFDDEPNPRKERLENILDESGRKITYYANIDNESEHKSPDGRNQFLGRVNVGAEWVPVVLCRRRSGTQHQIRQSDSVFERLERNYGRVGLKDEGAFMERIPVRIFATSRSGRSYIAFPATEDGERDSHGGSGIKGYTKKDAHQFFNSSLLLYGMLVGRGTEEDPRAVVYDPTGERGTAFITHACRRSSRFEDDTLDKLTDHGTIDRWIAQNRRILLRVSGQAPFSDSPLYFASLALDITCDDDAYAPGAEQTGVDNDKVLTQIVNGDIIENLYVLRQNHQKGRESQGIGFVRRDCPRLGRGYLTLVYIADGAALAGEIIPAAEIVYDGKKKEKGDFLVAKPA